MKIVHIIKLKNGKYKISLDNGLELIIYDDVILNNNLLYKKEIDNEILNKIKDENIYYDLLNSSIKYISKRLRSELEIKKYLEKKCLDIHLIESIIDELKEKSLIDDKRFCEAYINDKLNLTNSGILKIKHELINLGIEEDMIDDIINKNNYKVDKNNLRKLIDKKIKLNHKYSSNYLKQKIINEMINLGYEKEDIINILDLYNIDDNDIYQKEYDKLYHKLIKKYQGSELEHQINKRLYIKGFKKTR